MDDRASGRSGLALAFVFVLSADNPQPPRKGCDEPFLKQLLDFKPITVVYVSCNVHTQARDVGWFLREADARGVKYVVESLRGFDLFPQVSAGVPSCHLVLSTAWNAAVALGIGR